MVLFRVKVARIGYRRVESVEIDNLDAMSSNREKCIYHWFLFSNPIKYPPAPKLYHDHLCALPMLFEVSAHVGSALTVRFGTQGKRRGLWEIGKESVWIVR